MCQYAKCLGSDAVKAIHTEYNYLPVLKRIQEIETNISEEQRLPKHPHTTLGEQGIIAKGQVNILYVYTSWFG